MASGLRDGIVHHVIHGQDDHRIGSAQPRLQRPQGPRDQEQRRPRKDSEKDKRAEGAQR